VIENARSISRLAGLGAFTAAWVGAASLHQALVNPAARHAVFQRYMKRWASSLVSQTGGHVILTPESRVPEQKGPRLIVSNHRSPFDIGVLLSIFGGHAVSRADLANWPVIGYAARRAGTIFVDRDNIGSGASAIREIRGRLQEGASILVFPEGGTFGGDEVRPFRAGAFAAVRGLPVEIVPVGLAYDIGSEFVDETFVEHVLRVARRPQTRCVVHVGTPHTVDGRARNVALRLQEEVQGLVVRAREHWRTLPAVARDA
jgi:lyso-ornithine lipid O-acyltransferase